MLIYYNMFPTLSKGYRKTKLPEDENFVSYRCVTHPTGDTRLGDKIWVLKPNLITQNKDFN